MRLLIIYGCVFPVQLHLLYANKLFKSFALYLRVVSLLFKRPESTYHGLDLFLNFGNLLLHRLFLALFPCNLSLTAC